MMGPGAVVVLLIAWVCATQGGQVLAAVSACPPWVIAGAVLAHLLTLALRTEAWRTVLRGAGGDQLTNRSLHTANAGAFLAGTVQGSAALPARIALIRRLGGEGAPSISQIALADAPIFVFEVCTSAVLAAIACTTVSAIPAWTPWLMLIGAAIALVALRFAHDRFRHHRLAAGLGVLASPALRNRLALAVCAFTLMALLRTWIVLAGFGLPSAPADVALVLFSMGTIGLLPIGVGTGPTATVVALGSTDLAGATAAGMVVSAATVIAVALYAGICWTWGAATATEEPELAEVLPLRPAPAPDAELDLAA
jgi:uncharacterized membrane protein YbhN (UPF0104 family)